MITDRFLRLRRGEALTAPERIRLEQAVNKVSSLKAHSLIVPAGKPLTHSTLLVDGFMCRYIDDMGGMRQLVAIHVPGDFVDLHGYPLKALDHNIGTLTEATIATVPHSALDDIIEAHPAFARKLWYATLLDAAVHRAWLFRLGRLDAAGRIAHFLCEMDARLRAVGLSDGRRFALDIRQTDLSEVCGLTAVHTNRVIRSLREKGLVSFRSAWVEIHDAPGLARRGEFDPAYLYLDEEAVAGFVPRDDKEQGWPADR
jgi:CRP-like cAMP-binding protein